MSTDRFALRSASPADVHGIRRILTANAEILAVAVEPDVQGKGVGSALLRGCVERAIERRVEFLWLATAKPAYFAKFGFRAISRWRLPLTVLLTKLWLIFQQPPSRWLPALFGRHTFMRYETDGATK